MAVQFTKEEIAYYKEPFKLGPKEFDMIAEGREYAIDNQARVDFLNKQKKKTLKDFNNAGEYEYYKASLNERATAYENGLYEATFGSLQGV